MASITSSQARAAVRAADRYLKRCGIRLPAYRVTTVVGTLPIGGAYAQWGDGTFTLNMGRYPTAFLANWIAIHELGHLLWNAHRPLKWKAFRKHFSTPTPPPDEYEKIYKRESWKTALCGPLSLKAGLPRPHGEPSWYGARAGGEERFCELLALIYANGDFSKSPPADLAEIWDDCWHGGLARMV